MVPVALSLGDKLTSEFFAKADAVACAKEISALGIPWEHIRLVHSPSPISEAAPKTLTQPT